MMQGLLSPRVSKGGLLGMLSRPDDMAYDMRSVIPQMPNLPAAPAPQAPQRERVSGWRILDRVLGGQTITQGLDEERARLQAEAMRPQLEAQAQQQRAIAESLGPVALAAFANNPGEYGRALSSNLEGYTLGAGGVRGGIGGPVMGAPTFDRDENETVIRDPLTREVRPVYTRTTPSIDETIKQQNADTDRFRVMNPTLSPGQTVNNLETGAPVARGAPRILAASDGVDLVQDDGNPIYQNARDEPPEAIMRREQAAEREAAAAATTLSSVARSREAVSRALDQVGFFSAGVLSGALPFNQSRANIEATLDTIKANLSFSELQQMRANSPTGGALGGIAVRELDLLGSTIASLDANQSQEELRRSLGIVDRSLMTIEAVTRVSQGQPITPEQAAVLPPGTQFIGQDGRTRTRQ